MLFDKNERQASPSLVVSAFKLGCWLFLWMLCRSVAVELEVTRELNKLLHSVETAYLNIVREVVEYAVKHNVTSATQLQSLLYRK
jgi:sensor domain CHASE-containing protein